MGSKTTTQETKIPEPTTEEREASATFKAILDAQMAMDYDKVENSKFVFKRQPEIDAIDQQIAQLTSQAGSTLRSSTYGTKYGGAYGGGTQVNNSAQLQQLQYQKQQLMSEGGDQKIDVQYVMKPEAAQRLATNRAEMDDINSKFYQSADKLLRGDFSVSPEQKSQIQAIVGENYDPVMNLLKAEFSTAEDDVKDAVNKLIESGKADIYQEYLTQKNELTNQLRQQKYGLENTAAQLGRSYSDTDFQRATAEAGQGAQERLGEYQLAALNSLGKSGIAQMAGSVANLRGLRAGALGQVAGDKAGAGMNLSMLAANPLLAFGAGGNFLQLRNALQQQGVQNLLATGGMVGQQVGQMGQIRAAQPTSTSTQPYGFLDILGSLAGAAGAGASAYATFGRA